MFQAPLPVPASHGMAGTPALLDVLARVSTRPRYAFMLLGLIAEIADCQGHAGPFVLVEGRAQTLRDWLCDALAPMAGRDPKRAALAERVRADLARERRLPADPVAAARLVEEELRDRIRTSGKTNLSRAVSELVRAGLLTRHYHGYAVDHPNRGAQRHAVYTLRGLARCLLPRGPAGGPAVPSGRAARRGARQMELAFK